MFVACGIRCLADVSSVSPSSKQTVFFSKLIFQCPFKNGLVGPTRPDRIGKRSKISTYLSF